ncbi:hypothetical protein M0R01_03610 [bacterium]|nr:hypothetical protein [bacterium]
MEEKQKRFFTNNQRKELANRISNKMVMHPIFLENIMDVIEDYLINNTKRNKVAINTSHGGFRLSTEAVIELIKLESDALVKTLIKHVHSSRGDISNYPDIIEEKYLCNKSSGYYDGVVCGEYIYSPHIYNSIRERNHPDLIAVIEKLGTNAASARGSDINIITLDDCEIGGRIYINEYDGRESLDYSKR